MKNNAVSKIRLLKSLQPNPDWLKSQRSNLLFEISESGKQAKWAWGLPVFSFALFCLIFGGGLALVWAAKDSLPGDLLYPIKIVAENTQVKVSSQENRPKLQAEFVGTRVEELTQVIDEPIDPDNPAKKEEKVVRAVDKLQAQIISAKTHLDKIKEAQPEKVVEAVEAISEKTAEVKEKLVEEFKEEKSQEVAQAIDALEAAVAIITGSEKAGIEVQMEVKEMKELPVEELPEIYDENN